MLLKSKINSKIIYWLIWVKDMKKKLIALNICIIFIISIFVFTGCIVDNNPSNKEEFYVSTSGSDNNIGSLEYPWRTIQHAMDVINPGDTVYVRGGIYNENTILQRSGVSNAWITFKNYPGEIPVLDGTGINLGWGQGLIQIGSIDFKGVCYVLFDGFYCRDAMGNGVGIRTCYSHNITISNCTTNNTGNSGITADNGYDYPYIDPTPLPSHIKIYNNYIIDANNAATQEALTISRVTHFSIIGNTLLDNHKEGICCKNDCSYGIVAYNDLVTRGVSIYIGSSINGKSHDFEVYGNYCHGKGNSIGISGENCGESENYYIYNNIFASSAHGFQYIDEQTQGSCLLGPKNVYFINNVFDVGNSAIKINPATTDTYIRNVVIRNNIIKGAYSILLGENQPESDVTIDHNLFTNGDNIYGIDYITGNPEWVNPSAGDYHLKSTSPAIDAGSNIDAPYVDYDKYPRPQGSAFDIGAFEYIFINDLKT